MSVMAASIMIGHELPPIKETDNLVDDQADVLGDFAGSVMSVTINIGSVMTPAISAS